MLSHRCQVLLVEDQPEDVELFRELIADARSAVFAHGFEVVWANTLAAAQELLAAQEFDIILLDLMLPDSQGMQTLEEMQKANRSIPIIVQTMLEDETVAVKALDLGACGYLCKAKLDTNLLVYAIRAAIERHIQLTDSGQTQQQRQEQELELLEQLMVGSTSLDSKLLGLDPLRHRMPDVFEELFQSYGDLLEQTLEQQIYKVEYKLTSRLDTLAEQLGYLKATPRDLIELHTRVLKQKTQGTGRGRSQAYTREGRFLLLELMGKLTAYYRRYYIGLSKINLAKSYNNVSSADE